MKINSKSRFVKVLLKIMLLSLLLFPRSSYASQVGVVIHLSLADKVVISSCCPSVDNRILNILLDVGPSLGI